MGWAERDIPDLSGKLAIVTGANSGLGFETARALAAKGARVVLACRNSEKGRDAEERIRKTAPHSEVRFMHLDLGSLSSVATFAAAIERAEEKVDILCNNAGVMMPPLGRTDEGFETQFGINHLGHFALTCLLADRLRSAEQARVVSVSSLVHFLGRIRFDDPNWHTGYNATLAYGQSKLANLLFMRELQRRLDRSGASVICTGAHPGASPTNLQRHTSLLNALTPILSQKPQNAALPTLYAATAPGLQGGAYFGPSGVFGLRGAPKLARSSGASRDAGAALRLWDLSEDLTKVRIADS